MPASNGLGSTYPKAWRTPTSPGSITTIADPMSRAAPRRATAYPPNRRKATNGPGRCVLNAAAAIRMPNATTSRTPPATSFSMETPRRGRAR